MTQIADIGIVTAFVAGLVSFLSPCVLPLVPGYISYLAGSTVAISPNGVAMRRWPAVDRGLLAEDMITLPVQVNGKKRSELTIATDASQADIETATLALDAVRRALDGQPPRKIVVVPGRIVNVVI